MNQLTDLVKTTVQMLEASLKSPKSVVELLRENANAYRAEADRLETMAISLEATLKPAEPPADK